MDLQEVNRKSRTWCFTINNYQMFQDEPRINRMMDYWLEENKIVFGIIGQEVGAEGTKHLQGYIVFPNAVRRNTVTKLLEEGAHVEIAKGSAEQNIKYCSKEGKFKVFHLASNLIL